MCQLCKYTTWEIKPRPTYIINHRLHKRSCHTVAGIILICKDKVLLVRSYRHWGFPKGTLKPYEASFVGACRELKEETGIDIDLPEETFQRWCPTPKSTFFIKVLPEEIKPRLNRVLADSSNDASGVGWFKIGCVSDLVTENTMISNCYLKHFLGRVHQLLRYKRVVKGGKGLRDNTLVKVC